MLEEYDYNFKIIQVGEYTEYAQLHGNIDASQSSRAGINIWNHMYHLGPGAIIKCDVWDFTYTGKNRIIDSMLSEAAGAVLVYDIYSENAFSDVSLLLNKLKGISRPEFIILLIGNKTFYKTRKRIVSKKEAKKFAKENGLLFEDINWNLDKPFKNLIKVIYDKNIKIWDLLPQSHEKFRRELIK